MSTWLPEVDFVYSINGRQKPKSIIIVKNSEQGSGYSCQLREKQKSEVYVENGQP